MSKLDMSDKRLDKLKLTPKTVIELLYTCRKTAATKSVTNANFYDESSSRKSPIMPLDSLKLIDNRYQIIYLLGQLNSIHNHKPTMTPAEGFFDFTGKKWTEDQRALFALYYLGTASSNLPHFIDGEKYAYSNLTKVTPWLKPTYPPGDPRFNIKAATHALEEIGIKLPDEQTHVD